MLKLRSRQLVVIAAVFILSFSAILNGCQSNDQVFPVYTAINTIPVEVTIDKIFTEYMADEAAANGKYKGERILFSGVTVEEVGRILNWGNNERWMYNSHIRTGSIKFIPRYTLHLDNVIEGSVVDIVGECIGLTQSDYNEPLLLVSDCWIKIVGGESKGAFEEGY
jgi:hypothetical protein